MARIRSNGAATPRRVLAIIIAAALFGACTPELDLRVLVEKEVISSRIALTLYDGTTKVLPGDTITWSDTIFGDPLSKTLTLKNDGTRNVTLTGPNIVVKAGGSGAAAFGNIVQPGALTLLPGASTTFSIDYTPPAADSDYTCDFIVNSNDDSYPAYSFTGTGHSTRWHGNKAIVSAASVLSYSCPKIAYLEGTTPTLYLAYIVYDSGTPANRGIALRTSTDGGKSWSAASLVVPASTFTISGFSFAAANSRLHLFYSDSTNNRLYYTTSVATPGSINFSNYVGDFFYGTQAYNINNSAIVVANGNVYLAAYDNTSATKKLYLYVRGDALPVYGAPSFTQYTIADGGIHTGGFYPSIKVDATNAYLTYLDSRVIRTVVVPLSSLGTPANYSYRVFYTDPTYNIANNALEIDSGKAYLLWSKADGSCAPYSTSSTNLTLSAWSASTPFTGEASSGTPNLILLKSGGNLYSAWTSYYLGNYSLRMGISSNGGSSWSNQYIDDATNGLGGQSTSMAVVGSDIYVAYSTSSGHPNNYSITLKKSVDGGATW